MINELCDAVPITAVPDLLPLKGGKRVHISTVWRWAQRGCRGPRLRLVRAGGTFVLRADLERFLAAINDPRPVAAGVPVAGAASSKLAAELDRIGV